MKKKGVLPDRALSRLVEKRIIKGDKKIGPGQIQPSSLDLRVGAKGYRIRSSFLPQGHKVREKVKELKMYEIDLTRGAILEKGNIYLIPLMERLHLPPRLRARANPKSSTGRLDIFTRVISDNCHRFEDIAPGYEGRLYLEIVPKSFTIRLTAGQTLNQLRIFEGDKEDAESFYEGGEKISDRRLYDHYDKVPLLFDEEDQPIPRGKVKMHGGLFMGIQLCGKRERIIGYKAKKNSSVIDLQKISHYQIFDFWEPITAPRNDYLILEPEEFYIFASKEKVRIPVNMAGEMIEFDAGMGELRTHYAGFFDSGFGYGRRGEIKGTKAVLEVRPHDVPFRIEDGQAFCKIRYEMMLNKPEQYYGEEIGAHYHSQRLSLSKHFNRKSPAGERQ